MSAIKLPVRAYRGVDGTWYVSDYANSRLCRSLTEPQAKQIALALNLHDELVEALKPFAACNAQSMGYVPDESAYLWKPSQTGKDLPGISVAHVKAARIVLARAETANETKP